MIESWYPFFEWCEFTTIGQIVRQSLWLFPVIEAFHLVAFALLGGTILVVDLRLLGVGFKNQSPAGLWTSARHWRRGALAVMLISGILLYLSEAVKCFYSEAFWIKISALLVAMAFSFAVTGRIAKSERGSPMSAAVISIATLVVVLVTGFMIFFTELPNWTTIVWIAGILIVLALISPFTGRFLGGQWESPMIGRLAAVLSILLWATVAWGGRWIGFSG